MDFLTRASLLGHHVANLKPGETVESLVTIETIDQFKELFGAELSDQQRAEFSGALDTLAAADAAPVASQTKPLLAYVNGSGELSAEDLAFARQLFPVQIKAVSGPNVTISTDSVIPTGSPPYFLNAGTLTFAGGAIIVENTVCRIVADTLLVQSAGDQPFNVAIYGSAGAPGATGAAGTTTPGQAPNGADSSGGSPGVCTGASDGQPGSNGANGGAGGVGGIGGPGLASMNANIAIGAFDMSGLQTFVIQTQSGQGGVGGTGGAGGNGQNAGNGGNGCANGCEGTDGGNGGTGGNAGNGGAGGAGGPGTDGLPIQISFPLAAKAALTTAGLVAPPGAGGAGGAPGTPGTGGSGGGSGKHHSDGTGGSSGSTGTQGATGPAGARSGQPAPFSINYT